MATGAGQVPDSQPRGRGAGGLVLDGRLKYARRRLGVHHGPEQAGRLRETGLIDLGRDDRHIEQAIAIQVRDHDRIGHGDHGTQVVVAAAAQCEQRAAGAASGRRGGERKIWTWKLLRRAVRSPTRRAFGG